MADLEIHGCIISNKICIINNVNCRYVLVDIPYNYADLPSSGFFHCYYSGSTILECSVISSEWGGASSPLPSPNTHYPIKDTNGTVLWLTEYGYAKWWLYYNQNASSREGFASGADGFVYLVVFKFSDDVYYAKITSASFPRTPEQGSYVAPTSSTFGYYVGVPSEQERSWLLAKSNMGSAMRTLGREIFDHSTDAPTDPYSGAGDSGTGGGGGTFSDTGDDIPIPSLPSLSAANAGFITLFNPSVSQLNALADYMWTNAAFDVANFKKIFEDPMDCILGLSIVPIQVTTSGSADVAIGNLLVPSIQFPVVSSQYQEFNCGSIPLTDLFFGGYLDYEPYTKIQIVLPYCGTFQISADDVMGKTITLVYHIDVLTGSCVAMLKCGNSVLYQFNGSCAVNIPINSINYASTIENATRIAVAIGTTVATAGAAAPAMMAGGEGAGTAAATLFNSAVNTAGATAEGALSMKPSIERSGALSSSSGMMSVQTPYIVITRPRICLPANQDKIIGYPSFITVTLSELEGRGYTVFDSIILENLFLTDDEKGELDNILRSGVYL